MKRINNINYTVKTFAEKKLKEKVVELVQCSRLTWKNIVYYCKTDKGEYAIKIYKENNNAFIRSNVEFNLYKTLYQINISVPKVYYKGKFEKGFVLIYEWIKGSSLKDMVKNSGIVKNMNEVQSLFNEYEIIWNLRLENNVLELLKSNRLENFPNPSMIYTRTNVKQKDLFLKFRRIKNIEILENFYNELKNRIKINNNIINSDISLHEVIFKENNNFLIDLESFTIGDINNDLAGIFYSLSNSILDNNDEIEHLKNVIKKNKYFNMDCFIFYLIERVLCANYLDKINEEEIKFYIKFIFKKNNSI